MSELFMTNVHREYLKSLVRKINESGETFPAHSANEVDILRLVNENGKLTKPAREKLNNTNFSSFGELVNSWKSWYIYTRNR